LCNQFGDSTYTNLSIIKECSVSTTLGDNSGGNGYGYCNSIYYSIIDKSFYNGSIILGVGFFSGPTQCNIKNCYVNSNIPENSAGFSFIDGPLGTVPITIDNCYVIGDITSTTIGGGFLVYVSNNILITNCYHIGNVITPSQNIGSFIGSFSNFNYGTATGTLSYCYSTAGSGSSFIGNIDSSCNPTINYCHIMSTSSFVNTNNGTLNNTGSFADLAVNTLFTNWNTTPDINSTTNTWSIHVSDYPTLNIFTDTSIWDGSYTTSSSTPNFSTSICIITPIVPCFAENTLILTNHGIKPIQHIGRGELIDGYEVDMISKSLIGHKQMIKIEKDALDINLPNQDTFVTKYHLFDINGKIMSAENMCALNPSKIYKTNPISEYVYHIILKNRQYAFITVNGLKAETLGLQYQNQINKLINKMSNNQLLIK
jgi:hypothetical protein